MRPPKWSAAACWQVWSCSRVRVGWRGPRRPRQPVPRIHASERVSAPPTEPGAQPSWLKHFHADRRRHPVMARSAATKQSPAWGAPRPPQRETPSAHLGPRSSSKWSPAGEAGNARSSAGNFNRRCTPTHADEARANRRSRPIADLRCVRRTVRETQTGILNGGIRKARRRGAFTVSCPCSATEDGSGLH